MKFESPTVKTMSWITGIAGKAEELLNKIDNNAAAMLKKESKPVVETPDDVLNEVKADIITETSNDHVAKATPPLAKKLNGSIKLTRSTHSSPSISTREGEEHLIEFLNNSAAVDIDQLQMVATKEPVMNGHAERSVSEMSEELKELSKENQMLKNEVRSLNSELTLLLHRTKTAEKDVQQSGEKCIEAEKEIQRLEKELVSLNEKVTNSENYCHVLNSENQRLKELSEASEGLQLANVEVLNLESKLAEFKIEAQEREEALKADILTLQTRLERTDRDLSGLKAESAAEVSELNKRLTEARTELEQYRNRAQRTLSEKDKLIAKLKKFGNNQGTTASCEDITARLTLLEVEQLRIERNTLVDECEELRCKLEGARTQVSDAERRIDTVREETGKELKSVEAKLAEETARRLAAEEHCNAHAEELHSVRDELCRQVTHLTERVRDREAELSRLRSQIAGRAHLRAPPAQQPSDLQQRISTLTSALVTKQAALEVAAKEKNELRLELDQTKNKFREYMSQVQGRTISVNDTDDAKLQVPSFLLESPFDTGVTRRVKRAYSSLDAVSVRTGVFLRRYPLARIFVFCYVIFLHFWVCLVLFSRTPETRL